MLIGRSRRIPIWLIAAICAGTVLSFLYGAATIRYRVFPFQQLRAVKQAVFRPSSLIHSDHYYQRKSFFDQHGVDACDIVMIGDSHIEHAEWSELFPGIRVLNRGIGEDTTEGVMGRLDSVYSTKASKAFVLVGRNDLASGVPLENVIANYRQIVNRLTSHGMKVFVISTILQGKRYANLNSDIAALNNQLYKLSEEVREVTYVDANSSLVDGKCLAAKYTRDSIHLNGSGYASLKKVLERHIK